MNKVSEAYLYYKSIRVEDERLAAVEGKAIHRIRQWTGYEPVNVGSFGLLLNLPGSDLDLSIGVVSIDFQAVCKEIDRAGCEFLAIRETRPGTVRHVYRFMLEEIEVDFAIMSDEDLRLLVPGLVSCRRGMTHEERIEHVYEKRRLREQGDKQGYANFKMAPYMKYCPGFSWIPLP